MSHITGHVSVSSWWCLSLTQLSRAPLAIQLSDSVLVPATKQTECNRWTVQYMSTVLTVLLTWHVGHTDNILPDNSHHYFTCLRQHSGRHYTRLASQCPRLSIPRLAANTLLLPIVFNEWAGNVFLLPADTSLSNTSFITCRSATVKTADEKRLATVDR